MPFKPKKLSGFTLIELLVVVSIISVLSASGLSQIQKARKKGEYLTVTQQLEQVQKGLELYKNDHKIYPYQYKDTYPECGIGPTEDSLTPCLTSPVSYTDVNGVIYPPPPALLTSKYILSFPKPKARSFWLEYTPWTLTPSNSHLCGTKQIQGYAIFYADADIPLYAPDIQMPRYNGDEITRCITAE